MQFQNPGPGAQMTLDVTDVEIFLEDSEKVPAAGAAARSSLALLLLLLAFWARRRYHAPQPA